MFDNKTRFRYLEFVIFLVNLKSLRLVQVFVDVLRPDFSVDVFADGSVTEVDLEKKIPT